jgi:hypothetical protein
LSGISTFERAGRHWLGAPEATEPANRRSFPRDCCRSVTPLPEWRDKLTLPIAANGGDVQPPRDFVMPDLPGSQGFHSGVVAWPERSGRRPRWMANSYGAGPIQSRCIFDRRRPAPSHWPPCRWRRVRKVRAAAAVCVVRPVIRVNRFPWKSVLLLGRAWQRTSGVPSACCGRSTCPPAQ